MYQPVRLAKIYARPLKNNKTPIKECNHHSNQTLKNSYKSRRLKYEKYIFFEQCVQQLKSIKFPSSFISSYQQGISYKNLSYHFTYYFKIILGMLTSLFTLLLLPMALEGSAIKSKYKCLLKRTCFLVDQSNTNRSNNYILFFLCR